MSPWCMAWLLDGEGGRTALGVMEAWGQGKKIVSPAGQAGPFPDFARAAAGLGRCFPGEGRPSMAAVTCPHCEAQLIFADHTLATGRCRCPKCRKPIPGSVATLTVEQPRTRIDREAGQG